MKQDFPLYKLMILEMLQSVNFPLTNSQITEFMVQNNYTTYFEVQQTFSQLISSNLLAKETIHHSTHYQITEAGELTLSFYRHLIPDSFIKTIKDYLTANKIELRNKVSVHAGYLPSGGGEYAVQLRVKEKGRVFFDMTLFAPSKEIAEQMCYNWEKKQAGLYSYLIEELVQESSSEEHSGSPKDGR